MGKSVRSEPAKAARIPKSEGSGCAAERVAREKRVSRERETRERERERERESQESLVSCVRRHAYTPASQSVSQFFLSDAARALSGNPLYVSLRYLPEYIHMEGEGVNFHFASLC